MTNIVEMNNAQQLAERIFPQESELFFRVAERPNGWLNERTGEWVRINDNKNLVREHAGGGKWLTTVGKNYKMNEVRPTLQALEREMCSVVAPKYLHNVHVIDKMSYEGRECFREYRFPNMQIDMNSSRTDHTSSVAFRIIAWMSYGRSSDKFVAGAVDFACDNGIVTGSVERYTKRHTSGYTIAGIGRWLRDVVDMFWTNADMWHEWQGKRIDMRAFGTILDKMMERGDISQHRAKWLMERFIHECDDRGNQSLWEVYSALTNYATHSAIRDTGNDHAALTRLNRETEATKLMQGVVRLYKEAV